MTKKPRETFLALPKITVSSVAPPKIAECIIECSRSHCRSQGRHFHRPQLVCTVCLHRWCCIIELKTILLAKVNIWGKKEPLTHFYYNIEIHSLGVQRERLWHSSRMWREHPPHSSVCGPAACPRRTQQSSAAWGRLPEHRRRTRPHSPRDRAE